MAGTASGRDGRARDVVWAPGLVTDTVLVMVQVKMASAAKLALSVTVMVTELRRPWSACP